MKNKMQVEIWSDVMCPFCYIGKRKFEKALGEFKDANQIEVNWKSFQLNPEMKTLPGKNIVEYLAEIKGWSMEQSTRMHAQVTSSAKEVGLDYHFDKAVVANSFDAHRLIQLAKSKGLGDRAEEILFRSYFTEGKNIADHSTLIEIGELIGLHLADIKDMLTSDQYTQEVQQDLYEAQQVGVRGVPFFVFGGKYAVSGAQPSTVFLEVIQKSFDEWKNLPANSPVKLAEAESCDIEGNCD